MSDLDAGELRFERTGAIVTLVIDRPNDGNRLAPVLGRMKEIANELKFSRDIHAVVIRGGGTAQFSLGVFGPKRRALLNKEQALDVVALANEVIDAVQALPQIVIAGLNGVTNGGGAELALGCDLRVAARHATMKFPEAKMGGFPGAGAAVRLPEVVGKARAVELICTGREIDAGEMLRIGFVQSVYDSDQFDDKLFELAASIAASGPLATRGAKRVINIRSEPGLRASRELSDALRNALEHSHDIEEGQRAIHERRAPKFLGR